MTPEQKEEVLKLQRVIKQCEGIIRTSRNLETVRRIQIDIKKAKERLDFICPDGVPGDLIYSTQKKENQTGIDDIVKTYTVLSLFSVNKLCPSCEDDDINFLSTVLQVWDSQFSPALSDKHVKLDFSLSAERDSHYAITENLKRQTKVTADTIEDFYSATREDAKAQLREMKARHIRHFTYEGSSFVKKIKDFWSMIHDDIQSGGNMCMNKEESIVFNEKIENITFLNHKPVPEAVEITNLYLKEALEVLNPPDVN